MDPILLAIIGICAMFLLIGLHVPIGIAMAIAGFAGVWAILGPGPAASLFITAPTQVLTTRELGAIPMPLGILRDDATRLRQRVSQALEQCDVVLLSGGTSKGMGDISYRIVSELTQPGIVAHGVALKPGKPVCLASHHGKPVVVLPGFPTSAIFTFHEFVAPVIRRLGGRDAGEVNEVPANVAVRINSVSLRSSACWA